MPLDIKHFVLSHIIWVVVVIALVVGFKSWEAEHDAHLQAQVTIAKDEQVVKDLQTQITANAVTVAQLQDQITKRDAANAATIAALLKAKQQAVTPPQQVAVLTTEAKLPAPIVSIPDTPDWRLPGVDVQPLFDQINTGLVAGANLATCTADLADVKTQSSTKDKTITADVAIIAQKDDEIKVLKQPKKFWARVKTTLKDVGIGIGIGYVLATHKL